MTEVLASRRFTAEELQQFAAASGDWNPIHVDAVAARRTLAGGIVVHGMLSLLWALEQHLKAGGAPARRLQVFFRQVIQPGEDVILTRETLPDHTRLSLSRDGAETCSLLLSGHANFAESELPARRPPRQLALEPGQEDLRSAKGTLDIMVDEGDLQAAFSTLALRWGKMPVACLMAYSRLVGMQCPGLHSLFTGLEVEFDGPDDAKLSWSVARASSPFAPLAIRVEGGGASGQLTAFVRPAPVRQASMAEIADKVSKGEFAGRRALIVGGSRGLGELAAKILAAGGCEVAITYKTGRDDAERLATDISGQGGLCRTFHFDSAKSVSATDSVELFAPDLLFYFATPRISKQSGHGFDSDVHRAYRAVYVDAFGALVTQLLSHAARGLWALYPSTIFVEDMPDGFREYATAKLDGEALCRALMEQHPRFHAMIERFPRIATDQTTALIPQKTVAGLPLLLQALRRLWNNMESAS